MKSVILDIIIQHKNKIEKKRMSSLILKVKHKIGVKPKYRKEEGKHKDHISGLIIWATSKASTFLLIMA